MKILSIVTCFAIAAAPLMAEKNEWTPVEMKQDSSKKKKKGCGCGGNKKVAERTVEAS